MAKQITGKAFIRVDGAELETLEGATFNPGGMSREPVNGYAAYGYKESVVNPLVTCSIAHTSDISLKELEAIVDATVIFETDTGKRFIMRESWVTEPPELDATAGTVSLNLAGIAYDED